MDKAGLVTLLLSALFTLSSGFSKKFHVVNLKLTWNEAQSYCRENFHDLATIENERELTEVSSLIEKSVSTYSWIGLYDDITSWRWSMDNTYLYNDGKAEFSNWGPSQPNNYQGAESCGAIYNGAWYDANCESAFLPLCYDENTNEYIPGQTNMTWLSAQSYCREKYTDLASVKNQKENKTMLTMIDLSKYWWFGLFRDTWKWSDQSNSSFRWWARGQPTNSYKNEWYASMATTGWYDSPYGLRRPFVCYSDPGPAVFLKRMKVELIPGKPEDLNDPVWQEAILEQMKKRMEAQGIQQTFKLRWIQQPDGEIFHKKTTTNCSDH